MKVKGDVKMAIKINVLSTLVPIEIGNLKFEVDVTDEKYQAFIERFKAVQKELLALMTEIEEMEKNGTEINEEETLAKLHQLVSKAYDELLGEGTFRQVYQQTPRIVAVTSYLVKLVAALEKEMEVDQKANMSSYLKAKQTKSKKSSQ